MDNLSNCQIRAWKLLQGDQNLFLTGEAGAGKSFLIRKFIQGKPRKKFPVLASTGAAAVLVGGRTFHSFMGLGIMEGGLEQTIDKALRDRRLIRRLQNIEGFVLDEVSMLSGTVLRAADMICRWARDRRLEPWGGLRVIAVGDFAQLPPVDTQRNDKAWAFADVVWQDSAFEEVYLQQNMRTSHPQFLSVLNDVRMGQCTERVRHFLDERSQSTPDERATRLFPYRASTENYNLRELEKICSPLFTFPTEYAGHPRAVQQLKRCVALPETLQLKVDCRVMLRQNDPKQRWVNGSTGTLQNVTSEELIIELANGRSVPVGKVSFSLLSADGNPVATASNFPVTLAYATTIHKAQGMTLDSMVIDLASLWEPGHAYVALSRATNPDAIWIRQWDERSIKADAAVKQFYQNLELRQKDARAQVELSQ